MPVMDQLSQFAKGRLRPDDPFFAAGDEVCKATVRKGVFDEDDEELCHATVAEFPCSVPNCSAKFDTLIQFEMHYNSLHRYPCATCRKQLPSAHLLNLHVAEAHDSFFKTLAERQPMYECFLEECDKKFEKPADRRAHCISEHKFPSNFRFDESYHRQKHSERQESAMETDEEPVPDRAPKKHATPAPKLFGRGGNRGRMWHSQKATDDAPATSDATFTSAAQQLSESLPSEEMS